MLILRRTGKFPLACSYLTLGTTNVSLEGAQYSGVWTSWITSLPRVGLALEGH